MPENNTLELKVKDTKPYLSITVLQADGITPVNLSTASATFNMKNTSDGTYKVQGGAVVITDPTHGICEYRWASVDTDTVGVYLAEFVFNMGGKIFTLPPDDSLFVRVFNKYKTNP